MVIVSPTYSPKPVLQGTKLNSNILHIIILIFSSSANIQAKKLRNACQYV